MRTHVGVSASSGGFAPGAGTVPGMDLLPVLLPSQTRRGLGLLPSRRAWAAADRSDAVLDGEGDHEGERRQHVSGSAQG